MSASPGVRGGSAGAPTDAVAAAAAVAPGIRERAAVIEKERELPVEVVDALAAAGLFRSCVPARFGGLECDVATLFRTIETVATADGSAGWCVMIGATTGMVAGYLEESVARGVYADAATVTGGVFAPLGRAVVDGDQYVATGRWPFASGCGHCAWLLGGCVIVEDGKPRLLENGAPDTRMLLFPRADVRIHDTWDVAGLRGTGSHDMEVDAVHVPAARSVSLTYDLPREQGPLYKFPAFGLLALGIAAVATGVARRAIEELSELAGAKTPSGSRRRLAERPVIQAELARAEAELRAARALVFESIERGWREAEQGEITTDTRSSLRLAATHATSSAARAVDRMYEAGGGTSIYSSSPLQRCFRDVHVATQHAMVASATWELVGRVLLGVETDTSLL